MYLRENEGNTLYRIFLWSSDPFFFRALQVGVEVLGIANSIHVYNLTVG